MGFRGLGALLRGFSSAVLYFARLWGLEMILAQGILGGSWAVSYNWGYK